MAENSSDNENWSEWTYYRTKDAVKTGQNVYGNYKTARTLHWVSKQAPKAKPVIRKLAPAGKAAVRIGGKAVVKIAPKGAVAVGEKAATALATAAPAAGPIGAVIAIGAAMGGLAEHFGVRTYIENEMRWIERKLGRNIDAKAPPPRW